MNDSAQNPRRTLIGRGREVEAVRAAVESALRGEGQALLVTGEPGIGKTRLVAEASRLAQEAGARVLVGTAVEGGGMPAFYPFYEAMRPLVRELETAETARDRLSVLAAAGVASARAGLEAPPALSAESDRLRLFDTVLNLLTPDERPTLLALDDVQWAEASTWALVAFIARALPRLPLVLVLAARPEVLDGTDAAASSALTELGHQRRLRHLQLNRLQAGEVQSLVLQVLGGELDERLATRLFELSEGNPFFVEEVLQSLRESSRIEHTDGRWTPTESYLRSPRFEAPLTLRLAIGSRLDRLPPECLAALQAASVLGRRVSKALLAGVLAIDPQTLDTAVAPALHSGLLRADDGELSFSHDTIRQAIYDGIGSRVAAIHAAAARAIVSEGSASDLERAVLVAQHWRLAGEALEAAEAAANAAELARRAHAYADALSYARQAVEQAEAAGAGKVTETRLRELRLQRGELALIATEFDEAESALKRIASDAAASGDDATRAKTWRLLGTLYRRREMPEQAASYFHEAATALDVLGDRESLAETLIELASIEGLTRARYDEAEACGVRALDIARELGSATLEASAALALAGGRSRASGPVAARPLLTMALDKAIAAGEPALASEVCATLSNSYYWTGEMQTARAHAEHRLALAEEARDVFAMRHAHTWLALVSVSLGQFDRARDLLAAAEPGLRRLQSPEPIAFLQIVSAYIDYLTGDLERAYAAASDAIALFERVDPNTLVWYEGVLVLICVATGRETEARLRTAVMEGRLNELSDDALPARSARTAIGLAYGQLGESTAGEACERALRPHPNDHHWTIALRSLASMAALRGDAATALEDLRTAETHTRAQAMLPDLALVLLHHAELEQARGAQPDTTECRALLESLGMRPALAQLDRLTRASSAPFSAPASTGAFVAGMTSRELEVLQLLAGGLTNAEIASRLVLSERTVINHLSHIFGKIGVANRAGAVAYAHRNGLA